MQVAKTILLGTSGYDYPEWRGVFYPEEVKRKDFLSYYSTVFNALELNNTFYNMPDAAKIASFMERSQKKVNLSIKANRLLTHEIDFNWKNAADDFKAAIIPARDQALLSAVLFQFPQSFHYTAENRIYLSKLIQEFQEFPVVIEFRHKEWIRESVFAGLVERKASVAFCDMPRLKALPSPDFSTHLYSQFIGPCAYIRLHGRNENAWYADNSNEQGGNGDRSVTNGSARYNYDYSDSELFEFVPVLEAAQEEGRQTLVFFNNHPNGYGPKNAQRLGEILNNMDFFNKQ